MRNKVPKPPRPTQTRRSNRGARDRHTRTGSSRATRATLTHLSGQYVIVERIELAEVCVFGGRTDGQGIQELPDARRVSSSSRSA